MHLTRLGAISANQSTPINNQNRSFASNNLERSPKTDSVSFGGKADLPEDVLAQLPRYFSAVVDGMTGFKGKLFRGAKPTDAQLAALTNDKLKITCIIDLCEQISTEAIKAKELGIDHKYYKVEGRVQNMKSAAEEIIKRLTNGENIYIHCEQGKDRTGKLVAFLQRKMKVNDKAIETEYTDRGGNISDLDEFWKQVSAYIK